MSSSPEIDRSSVCNPVLVLYLDGPMQAWGYQSRFSRRTSLSYPTKSGVLGILCAALGVPKSDVGTLRELATLNMEVLSLQLSSRWVDYHTVGGGYEPGSPNIPRLASGSRAKNATITYREYLADAKFGVLLMGDNELLKRCDLALRNPKWGLWLGRKACIPASPIAQGIFDTREDAVNHLKQISKGEIQRRITDVENFASGTDTLPDCPISFATREFSVRRVCVEDSPEGDF